MNDAAKEAFLVLFKGIDEDPINEAFGQVFDAIGSDLVRRVVGFAWPFYAGDLVEAMVDKGTESYADVTIGEEAKEDLPHLYRLRDHLNELIAIAEAKAAPLGGKGEA